MSAAPRSGRRVIGALVVVLAAAVAAAVWLATTRDGAPPAPHPVPPRAPRVAEPRPQAPRPQRPRGPGPGELTQVVPPQPDEARDGGEWKSIPRTQLRVTVLRADGSPAGGAQVLVLNPFTKQARRGTPVVIGNAAADEAGVARFNTQFGAIRVLARLGDEAGLTDRRPAGDFAGEGVTLRLGPSVPLGGRVVESGGLGVPYAQVRADLPVAGDPFGLQLEAVSAEGGAFEMPPVPATLLPPGSTADFEVRARGFPLTRAEAGADDLRGGGVVIELARGAVLRGRIVDPRGAPLEGASVSVVHDDTWDDTDGDGRFELALPRRDCAVLATPGKRALAARIVGRFRGDADADVGDVTLSAYTPTRGTVVDAEDRPLAAADVHAYLGDTIVDAVQTGDDGKFTLAATGPESYTLVATEAPTGAAWSARRHAQAADVRGGAQEVRIVVTGALTVFVRFLAEADRTPVVVPQVTLRAKATGETPEAFGWTWAGARIDSVRFEAEHAGTYDVTVEIPGYEPATAEAVEVSAEREMRIDVLFRKLP